MTIMPCLRVELWRYREFRDGANECGLFRKKNCSFIVNYRNTYSVSVIRLKIHRCF